MGKSVKSTGGKTGQQLVRQVGMERGRQARGCPRLHATATPGPAGGAQVVPNAGLSSTRCRIRPQSGTCCGAPDAPSVSVQECLCRRTRDGDRDGESHAVQRQAAGLAAVYLDHGTDLIYRGNLSSKYVPRRNKPV